MKDSQRHQLRASEVRTRLAEIAGLADDELTDEIRSESDSLTTEYRSVETQHRAALVAESAELRDAEISGGADAPDAEVRALMDLQGRASFGRYLQMFALQEQLGGAERELNEHRGLTTAGNVIPWDSLMPTAPSVELRADAVTPAPGSGNPVNQSEILQRVFARGAVARLGVSMPSVAVGTASYPIIGTGQSAAFVAKDGEKDAAAGAITPNALGPVRLQARVQFRVEDAMTTMGLESALREDLARSISDQLDAQVVSLGDARVRGFLATSANGGLADYNDPGAVVTFATAAEQAARGVDGRYAGAESELSWVVGVSTYAKLASLIQSNDSTSVTERLRRLLRDFMASANLPAVSSTIQSGIIAKLGADSGMNAVAPIWEGLRLIRDEVTNADKGQIQVTAVALHNFKVLRADGFVRTKLKLV